MIKNRYISTRHIEMYLNTILLTLLYNKAMLKVLRKATLVELDYFPLFLDQSRCKVFSLSRFVEGLFRKNI